MKKCFFFSEIVFFFFRRVFFLQTCYEDCKSRSGAESTATPIKFTEKLQNGAALRVRPQGWSLLRTLGFDTQDEETQGPDFYMPDGQGKRLSESYQM